MKYINSCQLPASSIQYSSFGSDKRPVHEPKIDFKVNLDSINKLLNFGNAIV